MNITEDLINVLENLTKKEFDFYQTLMDDLSDDEEERVESIVETKLKELGISYEKLQQAVLYYIGFDHGMEEGIRILKEEHSIE